MYSDERMVFKITNNEGKEVECEVLFTFDSEETGKSYIVYTDNTKDDAGNTRVYASTYKKSEEGMTALEPIESDKEWKIIDKILEELQASVKEQMAKVSEEE